MNVYSDSSHSALKYLKDTEVNINNVLIMTGDFNIRNNLWDPSFQFYSSSSDDLIMIVDSFDLALLSPTNSGPTRFSDTVGEFNSIIDLMFLRHGSAELNNHTILSRLQLSSDHAPLSINIPIFEEVVHSLKFTIPLKSDRELVFIKDIISNFKSLNTSNIDNSEKLEQLINQLRSIIEQSWTKNAKKSRITKHSKRW